MIVVYIEKISRIYRHILKYDSSKELKNLINMYVKVDYNTLLLYYKPDIWPLVLQKIDYYDLVFWQDNTILRMLTQNWDHMVQHLVNRYY